MAENQKKKILVIGSLAYDHVMHFDGDFKDVMLPNHYSLAVTATNRMVSYGGCGGNIAYNLKLLGQSPVLAGSAGNDFGRYRERLEKLGIDAVNVVETEKLLTAAAFICTDNMENQITFFDAGAMGIPDAPDLKTLKYDEFGFAIVSPDNPVRMMKIARQCAELGIPFVFDPAQQIPTIKAKDLMWAVTNCNLLILNDYEADLLAKKLRITRPELQRAAENYIETHGPKGFTLISRKEGTHYVRAVQPAQIIDPTGCGDAFRAGVLMGLNNGLPIEKAGRAGALIATYNLEHAGTQTHTFTMEEFNRRFEENFNEKIF
jgi:adenosine kinase